MIFDPVAAEKQDKMLAKLKQWYSPFEVLNMATAANAKLVKICDPRHTYPGKSGVIEAGALADMILLGTQIR